jgi:hypothetical protein
MTSPTLSPERGEERRLNLRTLAIASAASAAAALATSQLWIRGTWIAAALTPVLVTLVSEMLHRPTEKIARSWTTGRTPAPRRAPSQPLSPGEGEPPVRVYRQPSRPAPTRRLAMGVVAATAGLALAITVVTITAGELLAGESIGSSDSATTFVGGGNEEGSGKSEQREERAPAGGDQPEERAPAPDSESPPTERAPAEPAPAQPPTTTEPPDDVAPSEPGETAPAP